jgi:hypothetical protein
MSILSSTNSGLEHFPITEEFLLSSGWESIIDLVSIKMYTYVHKDLPKDKPLIITFNDTSKYYLYRGKCENINIDFKVTTLKELQELISYYFNSLKDPIEAILKTRNNKNIEWVLDCETVNHVAYSNDNKFYKNYK